MLAEGGAEGETTTFFVNQGYEVREATTTKHIFVNGALVASVERGSDGIPSVRSIHTDHLTGSSAVSNSTGNIIETLDYYPYGAVRVDERASPYTERRKYAGHEYDAGSGLSYMGARYYDPLRGRFISQDSLARDNPEKLLQDPQQLNSYSYARNNPLRYVDPKGESIADILASLQSEINSIRAQITALEQRVAKEASQAVVSVGTTVENYSQGSGITNRVVNALTQDNTAAYVAGGIGAVAGLAAGGILLYSAYGVGTVLTTAAETISAGGGALCQKYCLEGLEIGQKVERLGTVVGEYPTKITGFADNYYHGITRILERGVAPQTLLDTVKSPGIVFSQIGGNFLYLTSNAGVVLDGAGKIVTVYAAPFYSHVQNVVNLLQ